MPLDHLPDPDDAPQAVAQTVDGPFGEDSEASPLVYLFEGQAPVHELNWVTSVAGQAAAEGEQNTVTLLADPDGGVGQIVISNPGGTQILTGPPSGLTAPGAFSPPPAVLVPGQIQQQFGNAISNQPPAPPPPAPTQQSAPGDPSSTPTQPLPQQQAQTPPPAPTAPPPSPAGATGPATPPLLPGQDAPPIGVISGPGAPPILVGGDSGVTTAITPPPVVTPPGMTMTLGGSGGVLVAGSPLGGSGSFPGMPGALNGFVIAGAGNDTVVSGGGGVIGGSPLTGSGGFIGSSAMGGSGGLGGFGGFDSTGGSLLGGTLLTFSDTSSPQGGQGPATSSFQPTQTPSWAAGNQGQAPAQPQSSLDLSAESQAQYVDLDPQGGAAPRNTPYYEPAQNHHQAEHNTDAPALVKAVADSITSVTGTALGDEFHGRASAETFHGGGGDDLFHASLGNDAIHGDAGTDTLDYSGLTNDNPVSITGGGNGAGTVDVTAPTHFSQTFTGIEVITGSQGSDTITLSAWTSAATVNGDADDDVITGGAGDDTLHGDAGNDTLTGGGGADSLFGDDGDDILKGSDGAGDTLDGGAGHNTADYSGLSSGVTATFGAPGSATVVKAGGTDTLTGIGTFIGTEHADTISGGTTASIFGGGGNDTITGGGVVCGGAGADTINWANDIVMYRSPEEGGSGGDTIVNLGSAKFGFLAGQFGYEHTTDIVNGVNFFDANTSHAGVAQACWYVDGTSLMYDADGTSGGQAAVTIATGADIAHLDAAHVVIVDDAGHQV